MNFLGLLNEVDDPFQFYNIKISQYCLKFVEDRWECKKQKHGRCWPLISHVQSCIMVAPPSTTTPAMVGNLLQCIHEFGIDSNGVWCKAAAMPMDMYTNKSLLLLLLLLLILPLAITTSRATPLSLHQSKPPWANTMLHANQSSGPKRHPPLPFHPHLSHSRFPLPRLFRFHLPLQQPPTPPNLCPQQRHLRSFNFLLQSRTCRFSIQLHSPPWLVPRLLHIPFRLEGCRSSKRRRFGPAGPLSGRCDRFGLASQCRHVACSDVFFLRQRCLFCSEAFRWVRFFFLFFFFLPLECHACGLC